jgi:hypothetical protein
MPRPPQARVDRGWRKTICWSLDEAFDRTLHCVEINGTSLCQGGRDAPRDDLDNGRLVVQIGVAPLKPAEFVIFRIGQWTADWKP